MNLNCYISSVIGIGMLIATFNTMSVSKGLTQQLTTTLTPELALTYADIATERRNIYMTGLLLGLICAFIILKFINGNLFSKLTSALVTVTVISALFYTLMPKSNYMLNHLKPPEQVAAWLNVYRNMKQSYIKGFIFGSLISVPLALSMCV